MEEIEVILKVILLGEASVGKTVLLNRYARGEFVGDTVPTIGTDMIKKPVTIDNATVRMQLWDTAGQERLRAITPQLYQGCNAVLLVYDTTNASSFSKLEYWRGQLRENCPTAQVMLIGNKTDLIEARQVATEEGRDYAAKFGFMFTETSAKTNEGGCVDKAFAGLIESAARPLIATELRESTLAKRGLGESVVQIDKTEDKGCC